MHPAAIEAMRMQGKTYCFPVITRFTVVEALSCFKESPPFL